MLREKLVFERALSLRYSKLYPLAKRMLDLALCLLILPLALLMMALVAAAILIDSGRPIFFIQERIGRNGCRFPLFKFRTLNRDFNDQTCRKYMKAFVEGKIAQDDELDGSWIHKPFSKAEITQVGRILRKTSLDELPQILNVLRGDMSLIGPRPNVVWEVEAYNEWHMERLSALPGITGLAQVRGRSCISFDDIVRFDLEYIEKQSLKLDLLILWWTMLSVLGGRGAG